MQDFTNKKIVLGICGGIAAYKSAYLVRELTRLGAQVRVVMTKSAQEFISPLTFQALSGHEVRTTLFDPQAEKAMGHIELARWADYLLIAPASANTIAKLAHGQADDLLTTLYLVAQTPVIVCPAMNQSMWSHPATQENKETLAKRGVIIVGPAAGSQACGEEGYGRMSEPDSIINALRLTSIANCLHGKKVLITAGPTEEAIDPVRFISNHSSGKMGYALAEAAKIAGAEVTLISGPTAIQPPDDVIFHRVKTAKEMYKAVFTHLQSGMIFIGCAAVADFGVPQSAADKIKKINSESTMVVNLTANPDIISEVASSGKAEFVLGFAAETTNVLAHAKAKLQAKKMHMVVANQVGHGMAFDQDCNKVTVISEDSQVDLPLTHKVRIASEIVAILAATLQNAPLAK